MKKEQKLHGHARESLTIGIYILLVLLVAAAVNILASLAVDKFSLKADMTIGKMYELTDATREVVNGLDTDIRLICLNAEDKADTNVKEVLRRYGALSPRISVEYRNPTEDPAFAAVYEEKGTPVSQDGLIIQCGSRERVLDWMDLYNLDPSGAAISSFKAEQQITSALLYVTDDRQPGAAFVQGHNEQLGDTFRELFGHNNFTVSDLVLTTSEVPEDTSLLVIASPEKDFTPAEVKKLDGFMARGGSLVVFRHPTAGQLPNLDGFLEEWGLRPGELVVLEPRQQMDGPLNIVPYYYPHLITQFFADKRQFVVMPQSRDIELVETGGKTLTPVLISTEEAYGKSLAAAASLEPAQDDAAGPFILAATSEMPVDGGEKTARIFLAGSRSIYDDGILATDTFANADLISQVLSWCGQSAPVANVPAKAIAAPRLSITWLPSTVLTVLFLLVIPIGILLFGIVVFLRRRHL